MYELIDYLSKGSCLVVAGAGMSAELGLPDWKGLAEDVLLALRKANPKDLEKAEEDFAANRFPALLGRAWRSVSPKFIIDLCKEVLKDNGKKGEGYSFLTQFDFKGYLTTNLEGILARHFHDASLAVKEFGNSKAQLEQVDFDMLKCIVKIHGSLDDPNYLVLTEDQYADAIHDARFDALRVFLTSHFTANRVLFVGYSLSDPDLQFLLQRASYKLRRKTPLYALIANARDADIDEWDRKYNIRIISYYATKTNHRDLIHILNILSRYVALRGEEITAVPSLKIAQSLYMWHRFQAEQNRAPRADAFKALILAALSSQRQPISKPELVKAVSSFASMKQERVSGMISDALDASIKNGLVLAPTAQTFKISDKGLELHNQYAKQFDNLKDQFFEQIQLDLQKAFSGYPARDIAVFSDSVLDALILCFEERGAEIVQMVFGDEKDQKPHTTLFKTINLVATKLPESSRYFFISYVTQMLTAPTGIHERFVEYLAKAYFTVNAIGLDPEGELIRRSLMAGHSFLLDSNVLIPALTRSSASHNFLRDVLEKAKSAGIELWVTPRFLEETLHHFSWAADLVREFGEQSLQVLSAAMGRGHYRRNEALDGYIRYATDEEKVTFEEYVKLCIGKLDFRSIKESAAGLGVKFLPMGTLTKDNLEFWVVRDQTEAFINERAAEAQDLYKTETRMRAEAEVYAVVYSWGRLKPKNTGDEWRCSFLSRGAFLNRVAWNGPYPVGRSVTIRPDALYEFLSRFEGTGNLRLPLKDLMLATYFRSADYFIDKEKYKKFFTPLLKQTEQTYKENLESFRRLVSSELKSGYLEEEDELERPFIVTGLDAEARDTLRQEVSRLEDENLALKKAKEQAEKEIANLKARERQRRRFSNGKAKR